MLIQDSLEARGERQGVCTGALPAVRCGLRHSLLQAVFQVLDVLQQSNSLLFVTLARASNCCKCMMTEPQAIERMSFKECLEHCFT